MAGAGCLERLLTALAVVASIAAVARGMGGADHRTGDDETGKTHLFGIYGTSNLWYAES